MSDREDAGLKGPVREIVLEREFPAGLSVNTQVYHRDGRLHKIAHRNPDGTEWETEYIYDASGKLLQPARPAKTPRSDGGWMETHDVGHVDAWGGLKQLSGFGFSTRGASRVIVSYSSRGVPEEVRFENDKGEVATRVVLRSDERGNIVEALQSSGVTPTLNLGPVEKLLLSAEEKRKYAAFLQPGGLETRIRFEYDPENRMTSAETSMAGEVISRTVYTYNDHGEKATEAHDGGPPARFEYEYDSFGNWTNQTVHHATGSETSRRRISYYD